MNFTTLPQIQTKSLSPNTTVRVKDVIALIRFNTILAEKGFDNEGGFDSWTKQNYIKKLRDIVSEIEKAEGNI